MLVYDAQHDKMELAVWMRTALLRMRGSASCHRSAVTVAASAVTSKLWLMQWLCPTNLRLALLRARQSRPIPPELSPTNGDEPKIHENQVPLTLCIITPDNHIEICRDGQ